MTTAKSVAGKELKELLVSLIMIRLHEVGDRLQTHLTLIGPLETIRTTSPVIC